MTNPHREMTDRLANARLIPVITLTDPADAAPLAAALIAGGLPLAEITLRTSAGLAAIQRMSADPGMLVGAGTVTTEQQADDAKAAGAQFVVCPGVRPTLVRHCLDVGLPIFPGALTPSEVMLALDCGLDTIKFFPAGQFGGLRTIAALSAPFPDLSFIPTGGIDDRTVAGYLGHQRVLAVGGSWMVPTSALKSKDFAAITSATARAVRGVRRHHHDRAE